MTRRILVPLRLWPLIAAALAVGCSDQGPSTQLQELAAHRARWEAVRPPSYTYAVELLCFCAARGPVRVSVDGSNVTARVDVETGLPVEEAIAGQFPTVDGIFERLREALMTGAHAVQIEYDATTGVPIEAWIDYSRNIADEEMGWRVTEAVQAGE